MSKGRTLWEILTGRNQRDLRPLELQYHNPLEVRVGQTMSFDHDPDIADINFVTEKMAVYQVKLGTKLFYQTDYFLKGISLAQDTPVRYRLRLLPDENVEDQLGHKIELLSPYFEMPYDKQFHEVTLCDPTGIFDIKQDDQGNDLKEPWRYWRVEDVLDPYHARVTTMKDLDGNGKVEENELERCDVTFWDFHRNTKTPADVEFCEYLTIEMDDKKGYFTFLRGRGVLSSQVTVF